MPAKTIEFLTAPDSLGRCEFFISWTDEETGKNRSQVFFSRPETYGFSFNSDNLLATLKRYGG